jgi:O-antigen/teichoic acid export membrane protein
MLLEVLKVSEEMTPIVLIIARWGVLVFILIGVVHVFTAILYGMQRYGQVNKAMFLVSIPNLLGIYLTLELGHGLLGLICVMAATYAFQALCLMVLTKRSYHGFKVAPAWFSWPCLKRMYPVGSRVFVSKLADLASFQVDKILLALLVPISFVTMYDLGAKIASLMRDLPQALVGPLFPAVSEMHGKNNLETLWEAYDRGSKFILIITIPMLIGLWLTAPLIIGVWLGHVSSYVYQAVVLLVFAYWIVMAVAMVYNISTAIGWVKPLMQSALLQAGLNVVLSYFLILEFGFIGALIGTSFSITFVNVILYIRFCRHFKKSLLMEGQRFWSVLKTNIYPTLVCGIYVVLINQWLVLGERLPSLFALVGAILVYILVYIFAIRISDVFDNGDKHLLVTHMPIAAWLFISQKKENI